MPGLDKDVVVHRVTSKLEYKLVKQKCRRMKPNGLSKSKKEGKIARFLDVVAYLECLANIVPMPREGGNVCELWLFKQSQPKRKFSSYHIDILVDNTFGHAIFSSINGFSSYSHIKMAVEDR